MCASKFRLHNSSGGAALAIRITPRARRDEIAGVMDDGTVRVRLTSSISKKEINQILIGFLAQTLDISPSQIEIVAGETGKDKLVSILNVDADTIHSKIIANLQAS